MQKAPEEGLIWEWRAFGALTEPLISAVERNPVRAGVRDLPMEDIYFVPPFGDQNIKLRGYGARWVLKFKLLIESRPGGFELYREGAEYTYEFPVSIDCVKEAARLLGTTLPVRTLPATVGDDQFIALLAEAEPPAVAVLVEKKRSQFDRGESWVELASVECNGHATRTISLHSVNLESLKRSLASLPVSSLKVMNYVQACRSWISEQSL